VVTENEEVVSLDEGSSIVDGLIDLVRSIQYGLRGSLTELARAENMMSQLQGLSQFKAVKDPIEPDVYQDCCLGTAKWPVDEEDLLQIAPSYVSMYDHVKNTSKQYREELFSHSNNCSVVGAVTVEDDNLNYVDDYGFSDTEVDSDDILTKNCIKNVEVAVNEKPSDTSLKSDNCSSSPANHNTQVSFKKLDEVSQSSRPKCVRRILPSRPAVSLPSI